MERELHPQKHVHSTRRRTPNQPPYGNVEARRTDQSPRRARIGGDVPPAVELAVRADYQRRGARIRRSIFSPASPPEAPARPPGTLSDCASGHAPGGKVARRPHPVRTASCPSPRPTRSRRSPRGAAPWSNGSAPSPHTSRCSRSTPPPRCSSSSGRRSRRWSNTPHWRSNPHPLATTKPAQSGGARGRGGARGVLAWGHFRDTGREVQRPPSVTRPPAMSNRRVG
jgi:hypothetical protein